MGHLDVDLDDSGNIEPEEYNIIKKQNWSAKVRERMKIIRRSV